MIKRVFISYSRQDLAFATRLADDLTAQRVKVWFDKRDISSGHHWDQTVEEALNNCDAVVVILTPEAVSSQNVLDEIGYALEHNKHVIPILRRDCAIPMRIRRLQYIDFQSDYSQALQRLLTDLSGPAQISASPQTVVVENPFYTQGRINDPAQFFGRQRLIREIRSELEKRASVSVVGESQMGRSSLLYYLYATRDEWLPGVTVAYIDLQQVWDESHFVRHVLETLGAPGDTPHDLQRALMRQDVILLLDEIEQLNDSDFNAKLQGLLRSVAQERNIALCVATQHELEQVFPPHRLVQPGESKLPFHNG